jgi:hypothetical protein
VPRSVIVGSQISADRAEGELDLAGLRPLRERGHNLRLQVERLFDGRRFGKRVLLGERLREIGDGRDQKGREQNHR